MAWTVPTTWTAGQQVTKTLFNQWNADLACVGDHSGWSTWKPAYKGYNFDGGESLYPLNVGSGSANGRKVKVGKLCFASFDFQCSASASGPASRVYKENPVYPPAIDLPYAASTAAGNTACGFAYLYDPVLDNTYLLTPRLETPGRVSLLITWSGSSLVFPAVGEYYNDEGVVPAGLTKDAGGWNGVRLAGMLIYRTNT